MIRGTQSDDRLISGGTVAEVKSIQGIPRLIINNKMTAPVCYLPSATEFSAEKDTEEMKLAARYGVNLLVIPWATYDYADREAFVKRLKEDILFQSSMSCNPDAYLILRIDCNFPPEYLGIDIGEALVLNNGEKQKIASLASDAWYEKVCGMLRQVVKNVRCDRLLNSRIIGYEFLGGDSGEWFGPEYWDGKMDTSEPNRRKFAQYLKNLYHTDKAIQESWGSRTITLDTVTLPGYDRLPGITNERAQRQNVEQGQTLMTELRNRVYVDYLDYTNALRADRLAGFAKVIKDACNREKITVTYYGYHADCYTASSNHFAMSRLLRSPDLDVFSAPVSYQDRCNGGIGAYMGMVDAVTAAGKLWMDEGDYRSPLHTTPPTLPYPPTTELLDQVIRREMGKCMIYNTGVWWLSFNQGWFGYELFWKNNQQLTGLMSRYNAVKTKTAADICYILDESAMSLAGDANATGLQLIRFARSYLYRSGYRFEMHLLEDLINGQIDDAKVYIFANPWRLSHTQAQAVAKKVHRPGKTALYMYGSGATDSDDFRMLTGIKMRAAVGNTGYTPAFQLTEGLERELSVSAYQEDLTHGITAALVELALTDINPVYYADPCKNFMELGRYIDGPADGQIGFVSYKQDGWKSVFYGGMKLSPALISFVADSGGAHSYVSRGDVFHTDGQMAMLHITEPGNKTIRFPDICDIYNLEDGRWITGDSLTVMNAYRGQTILLLYGEKEKLRHLMESHC